MSATLDAQAQIRPISHESTNQAVLQLVQKRLTTSSHILDLGAGEGYFAMLVGELIRSTLGCEPSTVLAACDVTPGLFRYPGISCDLIGSDGRLPYADESFDTVCSLEVIEHVQDQFLFCREICRILRPGGLAIISTPNVLNMNSRYRMLHSGFATLFNPLSLSSRDVVHTSGHIHPISYYYLAYALLHAGAKTVSVAFDRFKRSALLPIFVFSPVLLLGNALFRARIRRKDAVVLHENTACLNDMRSWRMLTSRSIIVLAER